MSIKPRTIDNLGIEASQSYAKRQKELDLRLIEEARYFPPKIEGGISPYIPLLFEERFVIGSATVWAIFTPPANYSVSLSGLFSYQMIPSLGGTEKLQSLYDQLETLGKTIPDEKMQQYEYKTVLSFVQFLSESSRTFDLIKARCNQYQRG